MHHGTPMLAGAAPEVAEEVIIVTVTHSHAARKRSYELIAKAFGAVRGVDRSDGSSAGDPDRATGGLARP